MGPISPAHKPTVPAKCSKKMRIADARDENRSLRLFLLPWWEKVARSAG
jgi:hypothetical protein